MRKWSLALMGAGLAASVASCGVPSVHAAATLHRAARPVSTAIRVLNAPQALSAAAAAINNAQHTVQVEMYELGNPTLLQALVAAHRRGVHVWVLLDPTERQSKVSGPWLMRHGVTVRWAHDAPGGIDHVKLLVVDGHWVELGGVNWGTGSAWTRDRAVILPNAPVYATYYQRAWAGYGHATPPAGVEATPVLGPALVQSVAQATGPVWVIEDYLTDWRLQDALVAAAKRVPVHVIVRRAAINQSGVRWLTTHGVAVRWAPSNPWLHEKSVVVGSVWWVGSANGSWHGLFGPNVELDARVTGVPAQAGLTQATRLWKLSSPAS